MEVFKSQTEFCCVEFCPGFSEADIFLEVVEQLATVDELHYQVQVELILERKLEFHHERVVKFLQNVALNYQC